MGSNKNGMKLARSLFCLVVLAASTLSSAHADQGTDCSFGGPTPGWRALKLDLPQGSTFLTLELGSTRVQRGLSGQDDWHLASGIVVVEAQTLALEAFRVSSKGMAPRRAVVDASGERVVQDVTAPDVPYEHGASGFRNGLPAGSYYVIAFGSDGGPANPNEWWSAGIQVSATVPCTPVGDGGVFDFDQTDFDGTQVYAPGAGYADSITMQTTMTRQVVVGLMDAETQGRVASNISLDYTTPMAAGTVSQKLIPFVSTAGAHSFTASYTGEYPVINITGASVDFPIASP